MEYRFCKDKLKHICDHQLDALLQSFSGLREDERYIYIPFEDQNYSCLPKLDCIQQSKIHALSLFSGCGGLDIGTQMAGVKVISSLDFEPAAIETLKHNKFFMFSEHHCADIRNINAAFYSNILKKNNPEKLILVGGPPCQPFSKAGYWVTNDKRKGVDDERNMVGEYLRLISEIRPDGFLLENVESMLHPTNRKMVDFIIEFTSKIGYNLQLSLANAVSYGIPQKRKRVIFLASKNKKFESQIPTLSDEQIKSVNVLNWIGRFGDENAVPEPEESVIGKTYEKELYAVPPGHNYIALSARDNYPDPKFIANKRFWNFLLKLHPLQPSWTIAAQPGPWVGPFHWNNRRLRVPEVAAIQTFPIDYEFVGSRRVIQKQLGNAVPSLLGQKFVEHLIKHI
jgi:DNA (cytosine-5)-methyltransferase 1